MLIGFNVLGFAWSIIGFVIGLGVGLILGYPLGQPNFVAVGITTFLCDFSYRWLANEPFQSSDLFKFSSGGRVIFFPSWIAGLFICLVVALGIR